MLKERWDRLDPNIKRWTMIGLAGGALVGMAYLSTLLEPPKRGPLAKSEKIRHILTDTDPRSLTLDALAIRVKDLEAKNREIVRKLDKIATEIRRLHESEEARFKRWTAGQREEYERRMKELAARISAKQESGKRANGPKPVELPKEMVQPRPTPKLAPWAPEGTIATSGTSISPSEKGKDKKRVLLIREFGPKSVSVKTETVSKTPSRRKIIIPAGSILSGVLLNGMDAPTNQRARQDPQPVLVRIKREAILPNRYRSDIRECFLIAAGYGDMSSERAYLRSETLACIRDDQKVLETRINSYAVGEDGKVGIRGRLVSKQGRVLANAMLAGFAKGISQIFGRQQVPVVVTSARNNAPFQQILSADAAQAAAVRGVGEALETLARFYLDMAENLFPVIEVDAGRKVEFIVNQGFEL